MPLSDAIAVKRAGDLGLCRGTLETVLFQIKMYEKNKNRYWLNRIKVEVEKTLEEVPSFLGDTE